MITFLNKRRNKINKLIKSLNKVKVQYFILYSVVILKTMKLIEDFEILI